jgi:monoamine oxidase
MPCQHWTDKPRFPGVLMSEKYDTSAVEKCLSQVDVSWSKHSWSGGTENFVRGGSRFFFLAPSVEEHDPIRFLQCSPALKSIYL